MSLTYGFIKCRIISDPELKSKHRRAETQYHLHATLQFQAPDGSTENWDTAINVGTNDADDVLNYKLVYDFHHSVMNQLRSAQPGFADLTGAAELPSLDFLRSDVLVETGDWRRSDVMDGSEDVEPVRSLMRLLRRAMSQKLDMYVFGRKYVDGLGIHDVHMNQGSTGSFVNNGHDDHNDHNDIWQDGAVIVDLGQNGVAAYVTAFTQQHVPTDELGNPKRDAHALTKADDGSLQHSSDDPASATTPNAESDHFLLAGAGGAPEAVRTKASWLFSAPKFTVEQRSAESADESVAVAPTESALFVAARETIADPTERGRMIAQITRAMRELRDEAHEVGELIMSSPRDRLASLIQTRLSTPEPGFAADEEGPFDPDQMKQIMREIIERARNNPRHDILRPASDKAAGFPDSARVFVCGDWGTGSYGAPITARTITDSRERFDMLLHLGDVYYSGELQEVQERFLNLWPQRNDAFSRTLNGNHDMYSGGFGYFDLALKTFKQPSSYFALENKNWTLICLDTAYVDNDLDAEQVRWVHEVVKRAGSRKVILFSHHPLFSNFKDQGEELSAHLHDLLSSGRITAWVNGHEHHCVIYNRHKDYNLNVRCLGHGGMPYKRKDLLDLKVEKEVAGMTWRRMKSDLTPRCLFLDGPNEFIPERPEKFGPHGYAVLEFEGETLKETI